MITVVYVGNKDRWKDHLYGTNFEFNKNEPVFIEDGLLANKFLEHRDCFTTADDMDAVAFIARVKPDVKLVDEASDDNMKTVIAGIRSVGEFERLVKDNWQIELPAGVTDLRDLALFANNLVDRFGTPHDNF